MTHVADEKVINMRICPFCFLEKRTKPMTPSNYVKTNHSMLSAGNGDQNFADIVENKTMTDNSAIKCNNTKPVT